MLAQTLADSREPLVIVDRNIEGLAADLVQIDHERGAYLATRHLLELGHSRIGCITGPVDTAVSAMRVHGFIRAMAERGIEIVPGAIAESDFSCVGGYRGANQLFDTLKPSAIFAGNDLMGIGALRAAAERGIRVPSDCSIIGFDDIEMSSYTYPALSTVGQSVRALGEIAAQTLIERISDGAATPSKRRRVVSPRLVLRESTAPYGARASAAANANDGAGGHAHDSATARATARKIRSPRPANATERPAGANRPPGGARAPESGSCPRGRRACRRRERGRCGAAGACSTNGATQPGAAHAAFRVVPYRASGPPASSFPPRLMVAVSARGTRARRFTARELGENTRCHFACVLPSSCHAARRVGAIASAHASHSINRKKL
ncbi:MAG: Ribose operon repressor [Burkholderia plantarii]|nr:MAG: Ribose operon repressor [Burkholderia plantarii]